MNANEVHRNRRWNCRQKRGEYDRVHPNSHVNLSQSTNDVYPTAVRLALHSEIEALRGAMRSVCDAFLAKAAEFRSFVKMGRTQLQDAVPMTLGQEFAAFGHTMLEDVERLGKPSSSRDQHGRYGNRHRHCGAPGMPMSLGRH